MSCFLVFTQLFLSKGLATGCPYRGPVYAVSVTDTSLPVTRIPLDTLAYVRSLGDMANGDASGKWPVKDLPLPLPGALLPMHRIVSYYGNLYSKNMGILGELPKEQMLAKLSTECEAWQKADSASIVLPALHYIAVTAQGSAGSDGKYRNRMPDKQIEKVIAWSREIKGVTFLDVQVALSNLQAELPRLEKFMMMPDVHLGIDPEFSMKTGKAPGKVIGTMDAEDVNFAIEWLAEIVRKHNLPPKILIVHRFTQGMVTNYRQIRIVPEVQVVMDMDGWGTRAMKKSTWKQYIFKEPVQFAGFKLFYKNDKKQDRLYTPEELMKFRPRPVYIQYQ